MGKGSLFSNKIKYSIKSKSTKFHNNTHSISELCDFVVYSGLFNND